MSTSRLATWIIFIAVFAMAARISVDNDTWWHLRAGQWIIENRAIPQADPFSYTRYGEEWKYPGWLAEVPMYLIYRLAGPGGLNLWTAVMVTLAFVFLWHTLEGGPFLRAFIIVLAAAVSGVYWAARPYLVTFVLAAAFLWILEDFRWRPSAKSLKRLWWLPVLMVVWANSHGGFAVGFILWGVYLAGALWDLLRNQQAAFADPQPAGSKGRFLVLQRMLVIGLLMVAAVCLNPSGPVMLAYPFKTVSIGALQDYIQEWQSPNFHSLSVQPFAWLLLATLGAVGFSRRRLALTDFLLVAGFAYLGLMAGRNIALFALAAPPVLSRHAVPFVQAVSRWLGYRPLENRPVRRAKARLNLILLGLLSLAVLVKVSLVLPVSVNEQAFQKSMPAGAVAYIQENHPPGNLFNSYNWGGYLLWHLPDYPVFIDGRTDLYNDEIIGDWLKVVRAETGWQETLDRWGVRLILLEPHYSLIGYLDQAGWQEAYRDEKAVVYVR